MLWPPTDLVLIALTKDLLKGINSSFDSKDGLNPGTMCDYRTYNICLKHRVLFLLFTFLIPTKRKKNILKCFTLFIFLGFA